MLFLLACASSAAGVGNASQKNDTHPAAGSHVAMWSIESTNVSAIVSDKCALHAVGSMAPGAEAIEVSEVFG